MLTEQISRRDFLKASGALVVTFAIGTPRADAAAPAGTNVAKTVALDQVDGFVAIDGSGLVTVYSGKVDLGTGLHTALTQIAAEELSVPFSSKVKLIQGDTALTPDQGPTFGSLSIQSGGMQIRQACATAREALFAEGGLEPGRRSKDLVVKDGTVIAEVRRHRRYVWQARRGQDVRNEARPEGAAQGPEGVHAGGQVATAPDIPGKVTGDVHLHAGLPRTGHAARTRGAAGGDEGVAAVLRRRAAKKIPGYVATVRKDNFLAVVAKNEWAAIRASQAIKAELVDLGRTAGQGRSSGTTCARPRSSSDESLQTVGDAADALQGAPKKSVTATYDFAIHTHGSIGPSCAYRNVQGRQAHVLDGVAGRPICCAGSSRRCSACRTRTCAASTSTAPAATGATDTRTRQPTPR